jgi:ribosome modulation factor
MRHARSPYDPQLERPLHEAFVAGVKAGRNGKDVNNCPYDAEKESEEASAWIEGYVEGRLSMR